MRVLLASATLAMGGVALGPSQEADAFNLSLEFSAGDTSRGFITAPIYRAGAIPPEFLVLKTPGNCQRSIQVSMSWDEEENWVRIRIKGKGVLDQFPSVNRTEGVNFFENQWWPEEQSFDNGQYLLWFITSPTLAEFYYDVNTLELLGSEYDFATPPVPSIPIRVPIFTAIPSPFFQPDANGNIDVVHEYAYDGLVRPDLPQFSHVAGTFLPHTLCKTDPYRYDRTSTRPYSSTRPASEALTWKQYIENGLIFDLTVEPPEYATFPPRSTNVGVYQGAFNVAGNIPKGWTLDFDSFFGALAPPLRQLQTAPGEGQACEDYFNPIDDEGFDICGPPPGPPGQGGGQ